MKSFNISLVLRGTVSETTNTCMEHDESRYTHPKSQDMFRCLVLPSLAAACVRCMCAEACNSMPAAVCSRSGKRSRLRVAGSSMAWCSTSSRRRDGTRCRELHSPSDMTTKTIVHRIIVNSQAYEERQRKKEKSEAAYYKSKQAGVSEAT